MEVKTELRMDTQLAKSCSATSHERGAACQLPQPGQTTACGCQAASAVSNPIREDDVPVSVQAERPARSLLALHPKVRAGMLFAVACVTSPCCTPLMVPLLLVLMAGSPLAIWLGQHLGWVYGILTVISILSFVLAWRWSSRQSPTSAPSLMAASGYVRIESLTGDDAHAR